MKLPVTVIFLMVCVHFCRAQNPLVKMWDRTYGGLEDDVPACFQQTRDSGYILAGYSYSQIGGDKTEPLQNPSGILDFWIIKIDAAGNKEWDRDFGGANGDQLNAIQQTADGGYILGGMSASPVSGDKSQPSWGNYDYWIIRLDSLGNKLWDKDFGGTSSDQLTAIIQTRDNGFLLAGNSASGINGSKSETARGATDYWIVKTDSLGNMLWDKTFGGMDAEKLSAVRQTADGGYLLAGTSWSPAGWDKTDNTWGMDDYWIVKTDSAGGKQWDKDFGGADSDFLTSAQQSDDGGFVLGGRSGSGIGGNKTQPSWGGYDFWIVKTDLNGNQVFDKAFGGTGNEDEFGNIFLTGDHGFLIAGTSYSDIGGNKSESNLGQEQSWFLKLDSLFNKEWDKTVLTPCHDEIGMAIQTTGQCYAVVNANGPQCTAGGDRSQASWNGSRDYWIVKYCDSTFFPPVAAASGMQQLCPGTCTSFSNLSEHATCWQWSFPGAVPDTSTASDPGVVCYANPGTYSVTLIAGNAHGSDTLILASYVTVLAHPAPQGIVQIGDTLYSNPGAAGYQWYYNGNAVPGATDYFFVAAFDGDYNMIATDSSGCEVEAAIFGIVTQVHEQARADGMISFYPNPVMTKMNIGNLSGESCVGTIYNAPGQKLLTVKLPGFGNTGIDLDFLSPGYYILETVSKNFVTRSRFVKQ